MLYEKKQKELKNLCAEEVQLKRALAMRMDKESKQRIRRQKKKDMKEQHVQDVLGYLVFKTTKHHVWSFLHKRYLFQLFPNQTCASGSVTRSIRSVRRWLRESRRSAGRRSS